MNDPYQTPQTGGTAAGGGQYSQRLVAELVGTKPWVQFISILGFIGSVIMLFGGAAALFGMAALKSQLGASGVPAAGMMLYFLPIMYLLLGVIYLLLSMKLWKYGANIGNFAMSGQPAYLEEAIASQRSFWKMTGIMAIIAFVLGVVGAFTGGLMVNRMASELQRSGASGEFRFE